MNISEHFALMWVQVLKHSNSVAEVYAVNLIRKSVQVIMLHKAQSLQSNYLAELQYNVSQQRQTSTIGIFGKEVSLVVRSMVLLKSEFHSKGSTAKIRQGLSYKKTDYCCQKLIYVTQIKTFPIISKKYSRYDCNLMFLRLLEQNYFMGGKNLVDHWCSKAKLIQRASTSTEKSEKRGYTRLRSVYDCFSSFHMKIKLQTMFLNMTTLLKVGWPDKGTTHSRSSTGELLLMHPHQRGCFIIPQFSSGKQLTTIIFKSIQVVCSVFSKTHFSNPGIIPLLNCKSFNTNNCNK